VTITKILIKLGNLGYRNIRELPDRDPISSRDLLNPSDGPTALTTFGFSVAAVSGFSSVFFVISLRLGCSLERAPSGAENRTAINMMIGIIEEILTLDFLTCLYKTITC
jgi:hypothetical protein